jgi:hypothetical protein
MIFCRSFPLPNDGASHEERKFTETSLVDPPDVAERLVGFQRREMGKMKITWKFVTESSHLGGVIWSERRCQRHPADEITKIDAYDKLTITAGTKGENRRPSIDRDSSGKTAFEFRGPGCRGTRRERSSFE